MKLYAAVGFGLAGGLLLGLTAALTGSPLLTGIAVGIEPIGTAFVDLLRMVVIPLVAAVIFVGVSALGNLKRLGQIGGRLRWTGFRRLPTASKQKNQEDVADCWKALIELETLSIHPLSLARCTLAAA